MVRNPGIILTMESTRAGGLRTSYARPTIIIPKQHRSEGADQQQGSVGGAIALALDRSYKENTDRYDIHI
jgi:hypothetical protein